MSSGATMNQLISQVDWRRILLNDQSPAFLIEVVFRSLVMFICLLVVLRLAGKRGVRQLSIFEIVIIISLGSAAGDPMIYEDVGLLPAILVFVIIISLYRLVTWLTGKRRWFEHLLEGTTQPIIEDGKFAVFKFDRESMAQDEFFTELRMRGVDHLGQVRDAYLETSGEISVFFYESDAVKPGLPIKPALFNAKTTEIASGGLYACCKCGQTAQLTAGKHKCPICENHYWVAAISTLRIV